MARSLVQKASTMRKFAWLIVADWVQLTKRSEKPGCVEDNSIAASKTVCCSYDEVWRYQCPCAACKRSLVRWRTELLYTAC